MSESAKERVLRQYGSVGDAYVRSAGHAGGNDLARLVEVVEPKPTDRMLDIATGGGHVARAFAPLVHTVEATDLTPSMLVEAEKFMTGLGLTNVVYSVADAEDLPYPETSFDIVTCRIAPHHFPNPGQFIREVARVLKPGGRFGLIDSVVPEGALGEVFNRFELARDPSHVRSLTTNEWVSLLDNAALTAQLIEFYPKRHDFADWTDRANVSVTERPNVAAILIGAGHEAIETFRMEFSESTLVAFTDTKALILAIRD